MDHARHLISQGSQLTAGATATLLSRIRTGRKTGHRGHAVPHKKGNKQGRLRATDRMAQSQSLMAPAATGPAGRCPRVPALAERRASKVGSWGDPTLLFHQAGRQELRGDDESSLKPRLTSKTNSAGRCARRLSRNGKMGIGYLKNLACVRALR
jgi:hypothetical protein